MNEQIKQAVHSNYNTVMELGRIAGIQCTYYYAFDISHTQMNKTTEEPAHGVFAIGKEISLKHYFGEIPKAYTLPELMLSLIPEIKKLPIKNKTRSKLLVALKDIMEKEISNIKQRQGAMKI